MNKPNSILSKLFSVKSKLNIFMTYFKNSSHFSSFSYRPSYILIAASAICFFNDLFVVLFNYNSILFFMSFLFFGEKFFTASLDISFSDVKNIFLKIIAQ